MTKRPETSPELDKALAILLTHESEPRPMPEPFHLPPLNPMRTAPRGDDQWSDGPEIVLWVAGEGPREGRFRRYGYTGRGAEPDDGWRYDGQHDPRDPAPEEWFRGWWPLPESAPDA